MIAGRRPIGLHARARWSLRGAPTMTVIAAPSSQQTQRTYRSELSPLSFLHRSAYVYPDKVAVVHGERRYTYGDLGERVNRMSSALVAAGIEPGDRVAFLAPNIPALLEAHFAVPAAGGVLVAINSRLNSEEISYILGHSGSRFLFVDSELAPLVESLDNNARTVVQIDDTGAPGDPYEDLLAAAPPDPAPSWLEDEEETISINYT